MMLTYERLREVLRYEPETGKFFWRIKTCRKVVPGREAGYLMTNGYVQIRIDGTLYGAHILAWFYVHGSKPVHDIDHINRNPSDNSLANLRHATRTQNLANQKIHKNNRSGFKGVHWEPRYGKWKVTVIRDRKKHHAGYFVDKESAAAAYLKKAKDLYGEYACAGHANEDVL